MNIINIINIIANLYFLNGCSESQNICMEKGEFIEDHDPLPEARQPVDLEPSGRVQHDRAAAVRERDDLQPDPLRGLA